MIPDDARICRKAETVDGEEINGHLIETVPIKRSTLGMCLGLEDNAGIPVFSGDYIKVKTASVIKSVCGLDAAVQDGILLAEETDRGFLLFDGETFSINALQFLHRLQESGVMLAVAVHLHRDVVAVFPGIEIAGLHPASDAQVAGQRDVGDIVIQK